MGNQDSEDDLESKDEGGRRMGGVQEEDFKGDEGQVEDDEITDGGR